MDGIELADREFFATIREGREPNASAAQCLDAMRALDRLEKSLRALVFDAVIDNADRKPSNPNCLVAGDRLHLIDDELAFPPTAGIPGWRPP